MGAVLNGLTAHGGVRPFGATYLTFYDYMRPAVRLSAMMELPVIYIFTHDSIAVGEDGPTHQPIEQLFGLRSVPNLTVIRPCDANEAREAWRVALQNTNGPTCLVLSRQDLPILDRQKYASAKNLEQGAYTISDSQGGNPELILIGTGAEVHLALEAQLILADLDIRARVISMPSWDLFAAQPESYRQSVFPDTIKARIAIEAGSTLGWERWVGDQGKIIGIDHFGISAPAKFLFNMFGFTVDNVVKTARKLLGR
jgi:transketolase